MGATHSSGPKDQRMPSVRGSTSSTSRAQSRRKESMPFLHGFLASLGDNSSSSDNTCRPRSGSFGRSFRGLSKSSHSRLSASKRPQRQLCPALSSTSTVTRSSSGCASPMPSEGSLTPTNPAYFASTSRGRRTEAVKASGRIRRSRSHSQRLLREALSVSAMGFPQDLPPLPATKEGSRAQDEHRQRQGRDRSIQAVEPPPDDGTDRNSEQQQRTRGGARSKSPAVPFRQRPKTQHEEEDEISVAHAEKMYDRATWRMYERIMTARARQQQVQAGLDAADSAVGQIPANAAQQQQLQQKYQRPLFRLPNPAAPGAAYDGPPWKGYIDGQPIGDNDSPCHSYPRIFSLDMDQ